MRKIARIVVHMPAAGCPGIKIDPFQPGGLFLFVVQIFYLVNTSLVSGAWGAEPRTFCKEMGDAPKIRGTA